MGKKTGKQFEKYEERLRYLGWQFLRRNREYNEDYKSYEKNLSKEKEKLRQTHSSDSYYPFQNQQIRYFKAKYGIGPLNPCFPDFLVTGPRQGHLLRVAPFFDMSVKCLSPDYRSERDRYGTVMIPLTKEELSKKRTVKISIDLNAPLNTIVSRVRKIVLEWKEKTGKTRPGRGSDLRNLNGIFKYLTEDKKVGSGKNWRRNTTRTPQHQNDR